jgi:hypothetical protein
MAGSSGMLSGTLPLGVVSRLHCGPPRGRVHLAPDGPRPDSGPPTGRRNTSYTNVIGHRRSLTSCQMRHSLTFLFLYGGQRRANRAGSLGLPFVRVRVVKPPRWRQQSPNPEEAPMALETLQAQADARRRGGHGQSPDGAGGERDQPSRGSHRRGRRRGRVAHATRMVHVVLQTAV